MPLGRHLCNLFKRSFVSETTHKRWASLRAARIEKLGQKIQIVETKPVKKLETGQVRIDVHNCALNASDFVLCEGGNPSSLKFPLVPGYEVSGIVKEANGTQEIREGDRVVALSKDTLGGLSSECVAHENDVWVLPSNLEFDKGAAIADAFGTAMLGLVYRGHLSEKQTVLVTMAPGHGFAHLELAANVYKAKVIAICQNEKDSQLLRERGAWTAMSYNEKEMAQSVNELTKGKGVDVIYDTLAGDVLTTSLKCIRYNGSIIIAGYTLQDLPKIPISYLLSLPSFNLSCVSLASYRKHAFVTYRQAVTDVLEMNEQGLARPIIAAKFKLEEIDKAVEMFKNEQPIGKIVLDVKAA